MVGLMRCAHSELSPVATERLQYRSFAVSRINNSRHDLDVQRIHERLERGEGDSSQRKTALSDGWGLCDSEDVHDCGANSEDKSGGHADRL